MSDSATDVFRVSTQKGMALLVYLAMNPGRAIGRPVLADLLWGDRVDAQARQNLRQCLLTLRRDLEPMMSSVLLADDQSIGLRAEAIHVDAVTFAQAANASDFAERQQCLTLPWGSFLQDFHTGADAFDEWAAAERNRLDALAVRTFAEMADRLDAAGDGERAIAALERLVAIDPAEEDRHRRLLSLEARYRGADAALGRAKTLAHELMRAVDEAPEPATLALIENIRRGAVVQFKAETGGQRAIAPSASAGEERPVPRPDAETVPSQAPPPAAGHPDSLQDAPDVPRGRVSRRRNFARLAATAAVASLVIAGGIFALRHDPPRHRNGDPAIEARVVADSSWQSPRLPSHSAAETTGRGGGIVGIAVLPFTVLGEAGEPSNTLAEILTDDLTTILSRMASFRVISRQTVKSFRQPADAAAVGAELGVRYLLMGSAEVRDNRMRVNVELVEAARKSRVWSGRFERDGADRSGLQDEIVNGLGRELQIEITRAEGGRSSEHPDVHELIFKGWSAMATAASTGAGALQQAEAYFSQALAREPDNPRAQTGLGAYHVNMAAQLFAPDPAAHLAKGEALLRGVIERHPNLDGPHQYMGLAYVVSGRRGEAGAWFERAIELNPSQAPAYAQLGRVLASQGRPEDGLAHILYAVRLSPRDPGMSYWLGFAGFAELEAQHYAKAIEYLERALVLNPGQPRTTLTLVAAHALAGNIPAARESLDQLQKRLPHLTHEKLIERFFGGAKSPPPRLSEGLRLAMAPATDPWTSPRRPAGSAGIGSAASLRPIAVLPFTTYGDTAGSLQLTADMIADDLTNSLARVPGLRVISRQTMRTYQGQPVDTAAIGAELGVRYVLEGSMRMRDAKLRVNVELIDPKTRSPVWSGRIEREHADRQGIQDEIVGRLARELQFEVAQAESRRSSAEPGIDELIFKGWAAILAGGKSGVSALKQAEAYFTQALQLSPGNPYAQIGLAGYHVSVQFDAADRAPHLAKAEELLQDVFSRHAGDSNAYYYMGLIQRVRGDSKVAIEWYERAVTVNASHAPAYALLGHALTRIGQPNQGLDYVQYAMRLSPRDPAMPIWLRIAGETELELGHHDQAIEHFRRSLVLHPRHPYPLAGMAAAHALAGRMSEARSGVTELKAAAPHQSEERLLERFAGDKGMPEAQIVKGLRLAMAPPTDAWASPRLSSRPAATAAAGGVTPIAVLPFTTYDDTAGSLALTADMITDDLTNMLSRASGLRVISRQTMRTYQGRSIDVGAIGGELGVRYVLEGSMRMRDAKVRVNVELIDPATRSPVWSAHIERDQGDHYGVQDEIVGRIARELQFEMYQVESERRSADHDADALAYRGWAAMWNAFPNSRLDVFRQAEAFFTQALERDPQHFSALVGLGAYHVNVGGQQIVDDPKPHLVRAGEILQEAIRRRPNHAGPRFYMGLVHSARGNLPEALDSLERAVDLNPSMASAHAHIGHVLARMGRPGDGLGHLRYAMRLSPRDPNLSYWLQFAGNAELLLNNYPQAIENYRRNPRYPRSLAGLAAAYALSGNPDEARVYAEKLKQESPQLTAEELVLRFARPRKGVASPLGEGLRRALSLESH